MTSTYSKKRIISGLIAAAMTAAIIAPTAAKADRWHHHHNGNGTAAAVVGVGALGLIAGTAIANNNARHYRDDDECVLERRRYVDQYGRTYFKRIEVCE
ncbi:hypothetical protein ACFQI3_01610 [Hansschlegelia quercus]|uniref:Uncharacterized protein n=1 Tax=Hansschlegelia quercus TaxID=2528245 RepID=A0A4V2JEB7_9HYPH|nr:hypothetical protein [Hansschlegelia quercus]TBN54646.1 hypothetical protein EYR15_00250 [Hansschlegelia quercus]